MRLPNFRVIGDQSISAFLNLRNAPEFIKENELWRGYFSISWISKLCVFVAILFSYKFISEIILLFTKTEATEAVQQAALPLFGKLQAFGSELILSGSMKYLILILLETVIFHFVTKTQEILTGESKDLKASHFIAAQIRMIKVAIRSWMYEIIASIVIVFALKLFGLGFLSDTAYFIIQFFFLGFAFLDNYHEQYGMSIKESFAAIYDDHFWAAIVIGCVAYVLFLIPLFGILITPFICAVGGTMYMHYSKDESMFQTI